jgi:molybdopterin synthase catalytic subunit
LITIAEISSVDLSLDAHVAAVAGPTQGAMATFVGTVRDHDPSVAGVVTALEYSAHPDAAAVLTRICADHDRPDITIAVTHRIGLVTVGGSAIIAAVASAHRREALDTLGVLIERIKAELPMWKKEILADGNHTWVGIS